MSDYAPGDRIRVAVDAMGGDHAPGAIVEGTLIALERFDDLAVSLVGDRDSIAAALATAGAEEHDRLSIVHASEVLAMGENPVQGLRAKPDNSITRAVTEVREGRAQAVFSAGNTGGMVAASTMLLDRIRGVKRPGIAVPFPTLLGACLVIDVGANIHTKPVHLLHYAHMAASYARSVLGIERPRVGMLNIGEEEEKGTSLVKETSALLRASGLDFVGYVEGHGIFEGAADVVVCDGFVGNVILKTSEGLAGCILRMFHARAQEMGAEDRAAGMAIGAAVKHVARRMDYAVYGGAPLLGFRGAVLIGHGRSSGEAVASALRTAHEFVATDVVARIADAVHDAGKGSDTAVASEETHP